MTIQIYSIKSISNYAIQDWIMWITPFQSNKPYYLVSILLIGIQIVSETNYLLVLILFITLSQFWKCKEYSFNLHGKFKVIF